MGECRNTAIVLAAGQGKRMHSKVQKQFLEIRGYPVLYYSLRCFQESPLIQDIILVTGEESISYCKEEIVQKYGFTKVSAVIPGGKERYDSVYNGLKEIARLEIADEDACVYIHDGARPCVDAELLNECKTNVEVYRACVPAVPVKDTIKIVDSYGFSADTPKRSSLMAVQTPQCFGFIDALKAYSDMENAAAVGADISDITDDAMVVERFAGIRVKLCKGSYNNIKVTTPEDIVTLENMLRIK